MPSKTFDKEELRLVIWEDSESLELIEDNISDTGRWSVHHEMVFRDTEDGRFYRTHYSVGATEQQDEYPFEYDGDEISCVEVEPVEVKVISYEKVKD
jgi:hypothetical protein